MDEELDKALAGLLSAAQKKRDDSGISTAGEGIYEQNRRSFVAGFLLELAKTIEPALKGIEERIEGERKVGRLSDETEEAAKELGAEVKVDKESHQASLILTQGSFLALLEFRADHGRMQVSKTVAYGRSSRDMTREEPVWLEIKAITSEAMTRHIGRFIAAMTKRLVED